MFNSLPVDTLPMPVTEIVHRVQQGQDLHFFDLNRMQVSMRRIQQAFKFATPYLAVKAIANPIILKALSKAYRHFEVATIEELNLCLKLGIKPNNILFSHPAKDSYEVAQSARQGVNYFTSDNIEDLQTIAQHAPNARVLIRLQTVAHHTHRNDIRHFNQRFGVPFDQASNLLLQAKALGLNPLGVAFHVGTQQESTHSWALTILQTKKLFQLVASKGLTLTVVNFGGGLPARYHDKIPTIDAFGRAIGGALQAAFSGSPEVSFIFEPGRAVTAMAGLTVGRVINQKTRSSDNRAKKIVTLSTGRFSAGMYGVGHAMAFYRPNPLQQLQPVTGSKYIMADIYGKACASFDKPVGPQLVPIDIRSGDLVMFSGTGAYCQTMATNWCQKSKPHTIIYQGQRIVYQG